MYVVNTCTFTRVQRSSANLDCVMISGGTKFPGQRFSIILSFRAERGCVETSGLRVRMRKHSVNSRNIVGGFDTPWSRVGITNFCTSLADKALGDGTTCSKFDDVDGRSVLSVVMST